MTDRLQAAYLLADHQTRRLFNQAIFARIWIDREAIADTELASPFRDLLADDLLRDASQTNGDSHGTRETRRRGVARRGHPVDACTQGALAAQNDEAPTILSNRGGSNLLRLMRMRGLEPPRPEGHRHLKPARLPIPPHPRAHAG